MPEENFTTDQDFDLDEDLFNFEALPDSGWDEEEADLDEIFANFEEEERLRAEQEAANPPQEEDPILDDFAPEAEPPAAIPSTPEVAEAEHGPAISAPTAAEAGAVHATPPPAPQEYQPQPQQAAVPPPVYYQTPPVPQPVMMAAPPAAAPTAAAPWMSRTVRIAAWILVAVTSVNALVAIIALKSTGELQRSVQDVGDQVTETATGIVREALRNAATMADPTGVETGMPLAAPNPENHPTFEIAREEIQRGEYDRARQRLYAMLAVVDRLDPLVREEIEARANYLLAQAVHLETVERWEVRK